MSGLSSLLLLFGLVSFVAFPRFCFLCSYCRSFVPPPFSPMKDVAAWQELYFSFYRDVDSPWWFAWFMGYRVFSDYFRFFLNIWGPICSGFLGVPGSWRPPPPKPPFFVVFDCWANFGCVFFCLNPWFTFLPCLFSQFFKNRLSTL